MFTIAVTGGAGLVGRHVVQKLLENEQIAEIRIIDRQSTSREENRRIKLFNIDINERKMLENAIKGCDGVVHCAHSPFPILNAKNKEEVQQMWRDNLDATEALVDAMKNLGIKILVNVGCAYCPIPNEDNYGLPQDVFLEYPRNYMLDAYGESRTRGEMYARKASQRGLINALFLRPTFVYGQGKSEKIERLKKLVSSNQLPYIEGDRRGMHQFIHAGNLAKIIETSFFALAHNPEKFNQEVVFCMDDTCVYPMRKFLENRYRNPNFSQDSRIQYWPAFLRSYMSYWKPEFGYENDQNTLNHVAFRVLFEKTVGFPNKKLRLLLDYKPESSQEELFEKYANPKSSYITTEVLKRANIQG